MNPIAIDLGFIQIYWYSITMLLAILTGSYIMLRETKKEHIDEEFTINLIFYGIILGIIGARLYYVLFNLSYYMQYPLEIIEIWNGGLAIHGAILFGGLWFIYYSKKKKVNIFKILDIAALSVIIAQAIGRWGNFFNGEAHGPITTLENLKGLPNFIVKGMYIEGNYYVPTFLYESLWNILGFIFMLILRKKTKLQTGQLTGIYFMWYSVARFFIESLRTDSLMLGSIKVAQLVSIFLFLLGLFLVFYQKKDSRVKRTMERMDKDELRL